MLGTPTGIASGIENFTKSSDYIGYMFSGIRGWICRGVIENEYTQTMYRYNGLMSQDYDGLDNVYISMNTFYMKERTVNCLKRLNALYVDIDCYKMGLDKEYVLYELEQNYFEQKIPVPTFVIDSGRGLYLVWKLKNEDRNALPRWTKVQNYFIDTLKEFGADPACRDCARILRVPFSRNSKSGTSVKIMRFVDLSYTISDIQKNYNIKKEYRRKDGEQTHPYNTATEPMRRYALQLALRTGENLPDFNDFAATQAWIAKMRVSVPPRPHREGVPCHFDPKQDVKICHVLQGYCTDIETLFSMRHGADCKREIALFLYRLFTLDVTGDKELALRRTLDLNSALSCPFEESYVIRATKSAEVKIEKGDTYHYKRETIIDVLEITSEEMSHLTYLVNGERRRERKKENNRRAYLDRLAAAGKETKAEAREKRRSEILAMQRDGKSAQEIMDALSISRATYYRESAEIAAQTVIGAATQALENGMNKIKEESENAVKTIIENIEKTAEKAATTAKEITEEVKGVLCPDEPDNNLNLCFAGDAMGAVSKNQPYNYGGKAKPCRTASGVVFPCALFGDYSDNSG